MILGDFDKSNTKHINYSEFILFIKSLDDYHPAQWELQDNEHEQKIRL